MLRSPIISTAHFSAATRLGLLLLCKNSSLAPKYPAGVCRAYAFVTGYRPYVTAGFEIVFVKFSQVEAEAIPRAH